MFTSLDKAIAAAIWATLFIINTLLGTSLSLPEGVVTAISVILAALLPYVVWQVPNKGFVKVPATTVTTTPTITEPAKPAEIIKPTKAAKEEVKRAEKKATEGGR